MRDVTLIAVIATANSTILWGCVAYMVRDAAQDRLSTGVVAAIALLSSAMAAGPLVSLLG